MTNLIITRIDANARRTFSSWLFFLERERERERRVDAILILDLQVFGLFGMAPRTLFIIIILVFELRSLQADTKAWPR